LDDVFDPLADGSDEDRDHMATLDWPATLCKEMVGMRRVMVNG
jgi:hypothetical protein